MSIKNLIQQRRTVYQYTDKIVDSTILQSCLETAVWAPNHKLTEPWRFWVIGSTTQKMLAEIYADNRAQKHCEVGSDLYMEAFSKAINKFLAIPKIILVGQLIDQDAVIYKEDYAACSCAIQNFQLAAWEEGIGVQWSTGPIIEDQRTFEVLEIDRQQIELIGALYLGYPKSIGQSQRSPLQEVTVYTD